MVKNMPDAQFLMDTVIGIQYKRISIGLKNEEQQGKIEAAFIPGCMPHCLPCGRSGPGHAGGFSAFERTGTLASGARRPLLCDQEQKQSDRFLEKNPRVLTGIDNSLKKLKISKKFVFRYKVF